LASQRPGEVLNRRGFDVEVGWKRRLDIRGVECEVRLMTHLKMRGVGFMMLTFRIIWFLIGVDCLVRLHQLMMKLVLNPREEERLK
jgi:hypothetical protein